MWDIEKMKANDSSRADASMSSSFTSRFLTWRFICFIESFLRQINNETKKTFNLKSCWASITVYLPKNKDFLYCRAIFCTAIKRKCCLPANWQKSRKRRQTKQKKCEKRLRQAKDYCLSLKMQNVDGDSTSQPSHLSHHFFIFDCFKWFKVFGNCFSLVFESH